MRISSNLLLVSFLGCGLAGCSQPDNGEVAKLQKELQAVKEEAAATKAELAKMKDNAKLASPSYSIPPAGDWPAANLPEAAPTPTTPPNSAPPMVTSTPTTPVSAAQDEELIQGDWVTGSGSSFVEGVQVIIAGNKDLGYLMSIGGDKCTYKIDPTKNPKTIDITSARDQRTMLGIYELKGGILTMAVLLNGSVRPDNYAMTAEDIANDKAGKSSKWVFVLNRK
jgi:uncharacterized protein (TIGR03067 family)